MLRERLPVLDGLRGIAVLSVILLHAGAMPWGWVGVDLFFVLSGFLITGILLDARAAGAGRDYYLPFYMRRSLRIFPLAFAAMAFIFFFAPRLGFVSAAPLREQIWYWSYLSNWWTGPYAAGVGPLRHFWSLAVEEQYYLIWPLIVSAVSRRRLLWICAGLVFLSPVLRLMVTLAPLPPQIGHEYEWMTPLRMDGLAAGSLVAVLARESGLGGWRRIAAWTFCIAIVAFMALQSWALTSGVGYVLSYSALALGASASIVLLLSNSSSLVHRCLSTGWLQWIGTVSYGAYVIHVPIAILVPLPEEMSIRCGALLTLTFALAALSWYAFESPILRLRSRWPITRSAGPPITISGRLALEPQLGRASRLLWRRAST